MSADLPAADSAFGARCSLVHLVRLSSRQRRGNTAWSPAGRPAATSTTCARSTCRRTATLTGYLLGMAVIVAIYAPLATHAAAVGLGRRALLAL